MFFSDGCNYHQNTRKKPTTVSLCKKTEDAVKMFKLVPTKLVDAKWRTATQADDILGQYRKFVSQAKHFHHEIFVGLGLVKTD